MMKDCNNMSRSDFLNYAEQFGKEAAAGLLLLCGTDGFDEDYDGYQDLMYFLFDSKEGKPLNLKGE